MSRLTSLCLRSFAKRLNQLCRCWSMQMNCEGEVMKFRRSKVNDRNTVYNLFWNTRQFQAGENHLEITLPLWPVSSRHRRKTFDSLYLLRAIKCLSLPSPANFNPVANWLSSQPSKASRCSKTSNGMSIDWARD